MKCMKMLRIPILIGVIFSFLFLSGWIMGVSPVKKNQDTVLKVMEDELARNMKILKEKGTPAPYFMVYRITDADKLELSASCGALKNSAKNRERLLDVDVRVGDYKFDNTHQIKGGGFDIFALMSQPVPMSLDNDQDSMRKKIWLETDKQYKHAVEKLIQVEANKGVTVEDEDKSDDFSKETPQKFTGEVLTVSPDIEGWTTKLKAYSNVFKEFPDIHSSSVSLIAEAENKYIVTSEGTSLMFGRTHWRISINAQTKAEDGMVLRQFKTFDAYTVENLPDEKMIKGAIDEVIKDVMALRKAPLMEPYTGPAILSGKASAVFFHEIFGHRIEGHRQKDENEGQTFAKSFNQQILPTFLSVYDDPTLEKYDNVDLNGHYQFDDEGIKAEKANLVEKGILKNFLMSRSPIKDFAKSNGHGRAEAGRNPVSRQGVLVVESEQKVTGDKLRQMLIDECKKQGKPYGLLFDNITGGFTSTGRRGVQMFSVLPVIVYRVYVDGRPDELVRGVSMIGTPLTSFSKIIACDDKPQIFNGYCGAESGSVPASCISPAILTEQIEVQKQGKDSEKLPVLPPPDRRIK